MIKNILFDMGGVIITINQTEAVRRFKEIGLQDADVWLNPYLQKGIFGEVEEGNISGEEFCDKLGNIIGRTVSWDECMYGWLGYVQEVPQRNLDTLLKLKKEGYRLMLLSNTNPFIAHWMMSEEFDGKGNSLRHYLHEAYMSFCCGCMKPSEQFYNHVINSEKINPNETLFLDDGVNNINAAKALGINTFLVENGKDWTKEIYSYL